MCSTYGELPAPPSAASGLDRLNRAIDDLADATQAKDVAHHDLARRLARVWDMVADLDPELASRLAGYER